jgi:hypothetical protein
LKLAKNMNSSDKNGLMNSLLQLSLMIIAVKSNKSVKAYRL